MKIVNLKDYVAARFVVILIRHLLKSLWISIFIPQVRKSFFLKKVSSKLRYQPLHKISYFVDEVFFFTEKKTSAASSSKSFSL